ncbi:MAG: arsenate reductase (glutaredoxin) [Planctomycetaceae bacterium]|nr:arsenate reductase (glutaredoxin) [Planctomycetaceae bacterium]|tara:strand:+ start:3339 stop:3680 length:342 start_codon:yes stop_codon:yes gene_type:complete
MKIYHNPRCSKSRQSLALIQNAGHDVEIIEYLNSPPTTDELAAIISKLGITAEQLVRKKEALFKELGLDQQTLTREQWIQILCEHPRLIERPIIISGEQAVIGRPPELIQRLL